VLLLDEFRSEVEADRASADCRNSSQASLSGARHETPASVRTAAVGRTGRRALASDRWV